MEIENLVIEEIINKKYKMMTSKEKAMFKSLKTKHLKREQLIKIICNLLLDKEDVEGKLSLYIRNQYITKKESITSIKREKSAKRELISDKVEKKKRGRTKGDKNITSEIIEKIEKKELHDGDYYKGIKIKLTAVDGETECKDCGSKLIDTGMKQYTVKIESEPMKLQLLVIEKPVMKCINPECETNALHTPIQNDPTKKGICSVNLLVEVMWQKFILGVPIDRLVKQYSLLNKKKSLKEKDI